MANFQIHFKQERMFVITGKQVREGRKILGWTVKDLYEKSGVGRSTIWRIESNEGQHTGFAVKVQLIEAVLKKAGIRFNSNGVEQK